MATEGRVTRRDLLHIASFALGACWAAFTFAGQGPRLTRSGLRVALRETNQERRERKAL